MVNKVITLLFNKVMSNCELFRQSNPTHNTDPGATSSTEMHISLWWVREDQLTVNFAASRTH